MSFAAFAVPGILAPLQAFMHWLVTDAIPVVRPAAQVTSAAVRQAVGHSGSIPDGYSCNPREASTQRRPAPATLHGRCRRPLDGPSGKPVVAVRMVRLIEAGQAPASAGRMVISGRMADVCAELDRLAMREAALH